MDFPELGFGVCRDLPNLVLKRCLHLFIFQARQINADIHRRSLNARTHSEQADPNVRDRGGVSFVGHFREQLVGFESCLHDAQRNFGGVFVRALDCRGAGRFFFG